MTRMRIDNVEITQAQVFEILMDNFPDIIHSVDDEGNIVYTNRAAEKLLGYTHDELIGMNIRQLYAEEIQAALAKGFRDLKATGQKRVESLLQARDGTRIPVEIRSFSLYDDAGEFVRTFSILRDVRQIKELQNSLVHAGRLAAIGELASGVAHDINNPLTVVLLSNDLLKRKLAAAPESGVNVEALQQHADDVTRAANSIRKIADHLRNFSRRMAEQYEAVDLFATISDALFITKSKVTQSGVCVQSNVTKGKYFTMGSPNQLEQVFVNLVGNACDAMRDSPTRDLHIAISLDERDAASFWRCDVADTGGGIPEDVRADIFKSFFTTKVKGEGTGLGLSISRGIVSEHGGALEVSSAMGRGSTFSIWLPRH